MWFARVSLESSLRKGLSSFAQLDLKYFSTLKPINFRYSPQSSKQFLNPEGPGLKVELFHVYCSGKSKNFVYLKTLFTCYGLN